MSGAKLLKPVKAEAVPGKKAQSPKAAASASAPARSDRNTQKRVSRFSAPTCSPGLTVCCSLRSCTILGQATFMSILAQLLLKNKLLLKQITGRR